MKTFEKIVQAKTAPKDNVIWLKDKQLLYFNNGQWVPLSDGNGNFTIGSDIINEIKESLDDFITKDDLEIQISSLVSIDNNTIYREKGSLSVKLGTGLRKDSNGICVTTPTIGTDSGNTAIMLSTDSTNNGATLPLFRLGNGLRAESGSSPKISLYLSSSTPLRLNGDALDINIGKGLTIGTNKELTVSVNSEYMTTKADGSITIDINKLKSAILDIEYLKEALGLI